MEKQIKRYIKAIRKRMACSNALKSQFIQDFENDILRYQSENSASYNQIIEHFGSPEQVASDFMDVLDPSEIKKDSLHSKKIYWIVLCSLIIVLLVSETGVFQWFAIKVAQLVRGEPFRLIVLLAIVTALCSAFLDNVTTILLMAPVSILLAKQLKLDPFPFIITEVMSANIGGLATLIGDPTQLIIGAEGNLGFNEFLFNTAPVAVLSMVLLIANVYFIYGRHMIVPNELKARIMELDSSRSLKDPKLLKQAAIIFSLVLIGFEIILLIRDLQLFHCQGQYFL